MLHVATAQPSSVVDFHRIWVVRSPYAATLSARISFSSARFVTWAPRCVNGPERRRQGRRDRVEFETRKSSPFCPCGLSCRRDSDNPTTFISHTQGGHSSHWRVTRLRLHARTHEMVLSIAVAVFALAVFSFPARDRQGLSVSLRTDETQWYVAGDPSTGGGSIIH